ncbi:hypothetical protein NBRC116599_19010 [Aquicoccus sp. SU-CL01552]
MTERPQGRPVCFGGGPQGLPPFWMGRWSRPDLGAGIITMIDRPQPTVPIEQLQQLAVGAKSREKGRPKAAIPIPGKSCAAREWHDLRVLPVPPLH